MKTLERQNRHLKSEKDDFHRELVELRERGKEQTRQLKDAHSQRKLAMDEFAEMNEK